ncbi:hypothetical protein Angca_000512 [Angiostrongylus cantonensis]|nr:hypothetical protein Angca_000512 [Angiostrongylus cantonensis]
MFEPFCSPIVPHIPIRQRLSSRRGTSVDIADEAPLVGQYACQMYGQGRRRRMSLLQTLRQQNRQLNDSGLEIHQQRTDSESTIRDMYSPPNKSPPLSTLSPSKKTFASLKSKLFGKREKRVEGSFHTCDEHSQSCDGIGGRSGKSPSTTNDSGRGSQPHLDQDRVVGEIVAIIERPNDESDDVVKPYRRIRTSSCPDLSSLRLSSLQAPIVHSGSEDDPDIVGGRPSFTNASGCFTERHLLRRVMKAEHRQQRSPWAQLAM